MLRKSSNVPQHRVWCDILLLPPFQPHSRLLPLAFADSKPFYDFVKSLKLAFQLLIAGGGYFPHHIPNLLFQSLNLLFKAAQHFLLTFPILSPGLYLFLKALRLGFQLAYLARIHKIEIRVLCLFLFRYFKPRALYFLKLFNLRAGIPDAFPHPAILHHALLHIFNVNILLHTDVFLYKVLQPDIHAERNRPLKEQRKPLLIQPPQINFIQLPAESLVARSKIILIFRIMSRQIFFHLINRHCPVPRAVKRRKQRTPVPEK